MATEPAPGGPRARRWIVWIYVVLALATFAVYSRTLSRDSDFINADDPAYVTNNPHVKEGLSTDGVRWALTTFQVSMWHPLTWISLQLDAQLFGLDARAFHLTNILLHITNTLLLLALLKSMTGAVWRSAGVAAFFALHPAHVESVAWVTERKDVLSALFWLLTIAAYVWYARRPSIARYLPILIALVLGLLAKPMAVTLPAVLLLLDYWPLRRWQLGEMVPSTYARASFGRLLLEKLPLFLIILAVIPLTMRAQASVVRSFDEFSLSVRICNALVSYIEYIRMMFLPNDLAIFYPHPQDSSLVKPIAAGLLLFGLTTASFSVARSKPYIVVGWLWFIGTLVPVIQLVQIGMMARADRYTYIPWIGLFLIGAWGAGDIVKRWKSATQPVVAVFTAALAACLILTWIQVGYWRTSESLWRHAAEVTRDSWVAHEYLGRALAVNGKYEEARDQFREALKIVSDSPTANVGLAEALDQLGDFDEAIRHFELSLRSNPKQPFVRLRIGQVFEKQGRLEEALKQHALALELDPDLIDARIGIAAILEARGDWAGASEQYETVLRSRPGSAPARLHYGHVLMRLGRLDAALEQYNDALTLDPKLDEAHNDKGVILEKLRRFDDAANAYQSAVDLRPKELLYRCNLGFVLFESGKRQAASQQFAEAFRIQEDWPAAAMAEAWSKATNPDAKLRNGEQAVRLAKMVCQVTEYQMPQALDILAAACAEHAQFADAVKWEQKTIELAPADTSAQTMASLRERLKLYEKNQPYREKPAP